MPVSHNVPAIALDLSLIFAGLVLLWRLVFSPAARARPRPVALTPWEIIPSDFLLLLWLVYFTAWIVSFLAGPMCVSLGILGQPRSIAVNFAADGGMLLGIWLHRRFFDRKTSPQPFADASTLGAGAVTFLMALPAVALAGLLWAGLMMLCGLPIEPQDAVMLFKNNSSPVLLTAMVVFAVVVAPLTEEMVFRWGIFRYARTRLPRWAALLLPACLFAAMHNHLASFAQLTVLGVIFSLAYERTGRIGTAVAAHAIFNGYSVLRIFLDPSAT